MVRTLRPLRMCWLLLLVALLVPRISAAQAPTPEPVGADSIAELRQQLTRFFDQPRFAPAAWGVKVADLETGAVVFEHDAVKRLSPASNSKLYSTALALDRLGADYRIQTPVLVTGAVGVNGELQGNLIVAGRCDPSWNPRREHKDFWTAFEPFVAAVRSAGIRRISGDVVADATFLRCTPQGAGWTADDLNDYYGAEVSAISLEENYVELRVTPGVVGQPCRVSFIEPFAGLELDNRTRTGPADAKARLSVLRLPGDRRVVVTGTVPAGAADEITEATVPNPALWFASALREALRRAGIEVSGAARAVRWPDAPPGAAGARVIAHIDSPPVRDLVKVILKVSQNLRTDLLFDYVGELQRKGDTPPGRTSDELALAELSRFLRENNLRPDDVLFDEGSGLSRNNLTTAAATVSLLQFMARHRDHDAYLDALPVAGVDGTLRNRLKKTRAEGNVRAKTGTLRWANSLSGYLTTAGGRHLVFSLMLNRYVPPADRSSRQEIDDVLLMLVRYQGRE